MHFWYLVEPLTTPGWIEWLTLAFNIALVVVASIAAWIAWKIPIRISDREREDQADQKRKQADVCASLIKEEIKVFKSEISDCRWKLDSFQRDIDRIEAEVESMTPEEIAAFDFQSPKFKAEQEANRRKLDELIQFRLSSAVVLEDWKHWSLLLEREQSQFLSVLLMRVSRYQQNGLFLSEEFFDPNRDIKSRKIILDTLEGELDEAYRMLSGDSKEEETETSN